MSDEARWLVALTVLWTAMGCGARSDLDRGRERASALDAGPRMDTGVPLDTRTDASRADAALPRANDTADADVVDAQPSPDASNPVCAPPVLLDVGSDAPRTVVLLVDASSSMQSPFGPSLSRWEAVRDALTGEAGILRRFAGRVRFGVVRYTSVLACPGVESEPVGDDMIDRVDGLLSAPPGGGTPTAETLDEVRRELTRLVGASPGPVSFVLATDGEPVSCEPFDDLDESRANVLSQVEAAWESGIRTFVLSVGSSISEAHVQDIANAGVGIEPGEPDARAWRADDAAGLTELLTEAVGAAVACVAELPFSTRDACEFEVLLGGRPLRCRDEAEYRIEGNQITFLGDACTRWENGSTAVVHAPCRMGS